MKSLRVRRAVILFTLTLMGLLCLSQVACSTEYAADPPTTLRVSVLPFLSFAPVFIAMEEGYFAEQGLELELVRFRSGPDALPALTQGQIDVLGGALSASFFNAVSRGLKIKLVADKGHLETGDRANAIVVRSKLYNSGVLQSLSDLKGKQVSFIHPANLHHYLVDLALAPCGLGTEDVEAVYLSWPGMLQALERGAIDGASLGEPMITQAEQGGYGTVLAYYGDVYDSIGPSSQIASIFFGPTLLRDNPDAGRRFILAYLKGIATYHEGKTASNVAILHQHTGLSPNQLRDCAWFRIHADGRLHEESVLAIQAWMYENEFIDQTVPLSQLVDTSFIKWAHARLSGQ